MVNTQELHVNAMRAALKHLECKGCKVFETNEDASPNIVAEDEDAIVLIDVRVSTDGFPEEVNAKEARVHFEAIMPQIGMKYGISKYRYDQMCFWVVGEGKAMFKYHKDIVCGGGSMSNLEWLARFEPEKLLAMIADQDRVEWLKAEHEEAA